MALATTFITAADWPNNPQVTLDISNLNIVTFVQNYATKEASQAVASRANTLYSGIQIMAISATQRRWFCCHRYDIVRL